MIELPPVHAVALGLGPRKFKTKEGPDMSDRSIWTDTPEDRLRKQREKVRLPKHYLIPKPTLSSNPKKFSNIQEIHVQYERHVAFSHLAIFLEVIET